MRPASDIFCEWVATLRLRRFHPIPPEIAAPFHDQLGVLRRRLHDLRPRFAPGRQIDVYADFVDDGTLNAAASVRDGIGLLGINKGAILLPFDLFQRMLSHPLVLQRVGDSGMEKRGPQHSDGVPNNYDALVDARRRVGRAAIAKPPVDDTRQGVAQTCADLAWGFIVWHELVHILHGHLEYRDGAPGTRSAGEAVRVFGPAALPRDIDQQALEAWADSKAVSVVLRGLLLNSSVPTFPRPQDKVFIWAFAIYGLFEIWGIEINPHKLWGDHPPTALRFEMVVRGGVMDAITACPELEDTIWPAVHAGIKEAEQATRYCGGEPLLPEHVAGVRAPSVAEHCDALLDHFTRVLSPKLPQYTHVTFDDIGGLAGSW